MGFIALNIVLALSSVHYDRVTMYQLHAALLIASIAAYLISRFDFQI